MVIDFHVHAFPDDLAHKAVQVLAARAKTPPRLDGTAGDVKRSMINSGVDCSVLLSIATKPTQSEKIHRWSAEVQHNGIIAFGSIHPDSQDWKDELRRIRELGLKGIKFHPDYQAFFVDEKRMFPIYEYAAEMGLIMVFHAGVDIGLPEPYHCLPPAMKNVVRGLKGGGAKIVAAHMGGYSHWDDVERFLVGEALYFDTSYTLGHLEDDRFKRIIREHGASKILFGTDSPWCDQREEIIRLKSLGLEKETEDAILGENAARLLGLSKKP